MSYESYVAQAKITAEANGVSWASFHDRWGGYAAANAAGRMLTTVEV